VAGEALTASTTLAIVLGGSAWPKSPQLAASSAFANSARGFREYLVDQRGFGLPEANLLDLFDSPKTAPEIVEEIQNYLRQRSGSGPAPRDLFLYYTGHGGFISGRDYFLAVRSTIEGLEGTSSIRVSDLAAALRNSARDLRRFLILDCCFAAAAFKEFQSTPGAAARLQTLDAFPKRGTTLLCSSSSRSVSIAPEGEKYTMFSGALLDVLRVGDSAIETPLSLEDVGLHVGDLIRRKYDDRGVRPEVHSPDQRDEDIARLPIFPNRAMSFATAAAGVSTHETVRVERIEPLPRQVASLASEQRPAPPNRLLWVVGAVAAIVIAAIVVARWGRAVPEQTIIADPPPQDVRKIDPPPTNATAPSDVRAPLVPAPHANSPNAQATSAAAAKPTSAPAASTVATARETVKPTLSTTLTLDGGTVHFASIAAGEFRMGCSAGDSDCEDDEKPVRRVTVDSFQLGTTEVTQEQWQAVMGSNPSDFKGAGRPVEHVSWNDAQEFLERLSARRDGFTYRLPTEAEWEYAARANSATMPALNAVAWFGLAEASGRASRPQAVATKAPNAHGLYDMLGNVAEWCEDWYSPNYQRVVRGGSWIDAAKSVRVSARGKATPGTREYSIGLRIVREPKS
jgi:formylglycine-generating enzyme required for sulfatase activity